MDMCGMMLIDMHGVTYANNLLKNPATKRLSGKNQRFERQSASNLHRGKKMNFQSAPNLLRDKQKPKK